MAEEQEQLNDQSLPSQLEGGESEEGGRDRASRMDAAKSWFRAMYAGAEEQPEEGAGGTAVYEEAPPAACPRCQGLETSLAEAEKRCAESENLYKRLLADFDNFRRRMEREREDFASAGIERAVESLLPALDDMDRAATSLTAEMPAEKILESVQLVFRRLSQCLEQLGVKSMAVIGEHFDPKLHEPVQEVKTTEFPDGAVMHELRRGYTRGDKVIRPALVNVASNTAGAAAPKKKSGKGKGKVYDLSDLEQISEEQENPSPGPLDEQTEASSQNLNDE